MLHDGGLQEVSLTSIRQRVDGEKVGIHILYLNARGGHSVGIS